MPRILVLSGAVLALSGTAHGASPAFTAHVTNPWFPLAPGSRYVYTGIKDGQPSREVLTVTRNTRTIAGKPCAVIEDRLFIHGRLGERTTDWYTQDAGGIGVVLEQTEHGGSERNELIAFSRPS